MKLGQVECRHSGCPGKHVAAADREHDDCPDALQRAQVGQRGVGAVEDAANSSKERDVVYAFDEKKQPDRGRDPASQSRGGHGGESTSNLIQKAMSSHEKHSMMRLPNANAGKARGAL
jgi:hypothetical protein